MARNTETVTEMQVRIAREMQAADPAKRELWAAMEDKARWYEPPQVPATVRAGRGK